MAHRVALVVHDDPTRPRVELSSDGTDVHFWLGTPLTEVLTALADELDGDARAAVERLWGSDEATRHVTAIGPGLIRVSDVIDRGREP